MAHPNEITTEFVGAVERLRHACPILFANIPFLKGVNDTYETLLTLCLTLYRHGVQPHYLYHFMPFSPGSQRFRADISSALKIVSRMKRRVSNIAVPEYVLPHKTGKFTVPLNLSDEPARIERVDGVEYMHFVNWQGAHCVFPE